MFFDHKTQKKAICNGDFEKKKTQKKVKNIYFFDVFLCFFWLFLAF